MSDAEVNAKDKGFLFKFVRLIKAKLFFMTECFQSVKYYRSFFMPLINHLTIGVKTLGKQKTIFPHPVGIVIGKGVIIGKNCIVFQNVTIGVRNSLSTDYPDIGDNVQIYAGAIIIGGVKIGNNAIIGAGCIVTGDVPENKIAVGSPMRIKDKKEGVIY